MVADTDWNGLAVGFDNSFKVVIAAGCKAFGALEREATGPLLALVDQSHFEDQAALVAVDAAAHLTLEDFSGFGLAVGHGGITSPVARFALTSAIVPARERNMAQ